MDTLSQILSGISVRGSVLARIHCRGEWGIDAEHNEVGIPFHHLVSGACWLIGDNGQRRIEAGDLVLAPHWHRHRLASSPDVVSRPISAIIAEQGLPMWASDAGTLQQPLVFETGSGGDPELLMLSGVFQLDGHWSSMLLKQFPSIVHLNAEATQLAPQLSTALTFITQESMAHKPGYQIVASRLVDLLFVQILRAIMLQPEVPIGLLAGLADRHVARALAAIHRAPGQPHTVTGLARHAALSRTLFARRFRETTGMTPARYLSEWRMSLAEKELAGNKPIGTIADSLGYASTFTFSRAFREHFGCTPREYRKTIKKS